MEPPDEDNFYISHAWCENDGIVIDLTQSEDPFDKDEYYQRLNIREVRLRRYTLIEACRLACDKGTYGPWDDGLFWFKGFCENICFWPFLLSRFGE